MKKLLYFFSICIILCITSSSAVFAAGHSASGHEVWNGEPPYINVGSGGFDYTLVPPEATANGFASRFYASGSSYGVSHDRIENSSVFYSEALFFNIGSMPTVTSEKCNTFNSGSFDYTHNGVVYSVYWVCVYATVYHGSDVVIDGQHHIVSYDGGPLGTIVSLDLLNTGNCVDVCKFFLFGVGDLDYELPAQDIPDESLDIVGLLGSVSDTYNDNGSFGSTLKSAWNSFILGLFDLLPDGIGDAITSFSGTDNLFASQLGNVRTTVPGIQLIWDSPEILHSSSGDDPITYTFWIDGFATADLSVYGEQYHSSVIFHKLLLRSSYITYNPSLIYYYSSNQDYQVVLDYIISNTDFVDAGYSGLDQTILNTTVSRIYIQASKVDDNGDNHYGAVSYVDFSTGSPVVFEGVTESIDDIVSSDSDTGTTNTVTQDFTVSGDTIFYGDTITNNNITNNITSGGLVVDDGLGFLNAGISLIRAVLEMIKLLFVSYLIPFITLGWTGHT